MPAMRKSILYASLIATTVLGGAVSGAEAGQVLIGSKILYPDRNYFSAPGVDGFWLPKRDYGRDIPESIAQIRMPAGSLATLRVHVENSQPVTGGFLRLTVRINGVATGLSCQVTGNGDCDSGKRTATLRDDDRLSVRMENRLETGGAWNASFVTYTIIYDEEDPYSRKN